MKKISNELIKRQQPVREVNIEDLLGRTSVRFSQSELKEFISNRTILITGGGGSIGSGLVRQLISVEVKKLIVFDINENDSYVLYQELRPVLKYRSQLIIEIGSITDVKRVNHLFMKYRPEIIFHAAAHKHVPLMENCPYEAVENNIFGTYNLLNAARESKCWKFVLISSDKAVNPINIMGATKRYCENMMRAFAGVTGNLTDFVSVRFGNVLGSQGSVVPIFQMQIACGGPVTITDKRITRYFMTISEATGLVVRAAAMAKCSETYILDMGEPIKIIDLAENLIRLSGYEPYYDIPIIEVGLRPGEKLYEELLANSEVHIATADSKIFIAQNDLNLSIYTLDEQLNMLRTAVASMDNNLVIDLMKQYIPDYKSSKKCNRNVVSPDGELGKSAASVSQGYISALRQAT